MTTLKRYPNNLVVMSGFLRRWLKNIRGRSASIPNLKYMVNVIMTAVDKAKVFNAYICSIFTKENFSNLAHLRNLVQASWSTSYVDGVVHDE